MRRTIPILALLTFTATGWAVPLQQAFDQAGPGAGYDRIVYLDRETIYTGGLQLSDGDYCIISSGAVVDLEGGRIIVNSSATLDISGVALSNSDSAALKFTSLGHGWVDHVTFCRNYDGLYFWQGSTMKVTSSIFANSTRYGVFCYNDCNRWMAYNDAWANTGGNYKEFCPS